MSIERCPSLERRKTVQKTTNITVNNRLSDSSKLCSFRNSDGGEGERGGSSPLLSSPPGLRLRPLHAILVRLGNSYFVLAPDRRALYLVLIISTCICICICPRSSHILARARKNSLTPHILRVLTLCRVLATDSGTNMLPVRSGNCPTGGRTTRTNTSNPTGKN